MKKQQFCFTSWPQALHSTFASCWPCFSWIKHKSHRNANGIRNQQKCGSITINHKKSNFILTFLTFLCYIPLIWFVFFNTNIFLIQKLLNCSIQTNLKFDSRICDSKIVNPICFPFVASSRQFLCKTILAWLLRVDFTNFFWTAFAQVDLNYSFLKHGVRQACQTGGPIACLMRPAVTYLNHTITWNCK